MTIPYKISYFLIFFTIPLMGSFLLLFIRFLFLENKHHIRNFNYNGDNNNNNRNKKLKKYFILSLFLYTSAIIGFIFTLSSFSSWNYLPIELTTITSIIILLFFTFYQLIIQFEVERKKRIFKVRKNKNKKYFIQSPPNFNNGIILNNNNNNNYEDDKSNIKENILLESLNSKQDGVVIAAAEEEYYEQEEEEEEEYNENKSFYNYSNQIDTKLGILDRFKKKIIYFIKDIIETIKFKPKLSITLILISLLISIMIPVLLNDVCICSHPMNVSTSFTRKLFQESYCKNGEICFLYLTLPKDASTSMVLQIHTFNKPSNIIITITKNTNTTGGGGGGGGGSGEDIISISKFNFISMSKIINDYPRYISYIDLIGLKENTNYSFKVNFTSKEIQKTLNTYDGVNLFQFKTFSNQSDSIIKFVSGGDIVINKDSKDLAKHASINFNPDFIVVGGDVVYEDGIGSCYKRWDEKLSFFNTYFNLKISNNNSSSSSSLFLKPILLSIGNHEAGAFYQTHKQVPFYFKYFLFELDGFKDGIDENKNSYHIHKIASHTSITSLDSCVVSTWDQQAQWLHNQWSNEEFNNTNKLVVYHHPIYPAWNLDGLIPESGRDVMIPLFDKFKVPFVFENHEHLFRRTKKLKGNKIIENNSTTTTTTLSQGTYYAGSGSFGISNTNIIPSNNDESLPWYLAKRSYCNHLWYITATQKEILVEAFAPNGDKIDKINYIQN
ncbi:hypothetical protein DDB_G0281473 [Dictyostelium discoideum AX4]|uniref:Calcineurin-like phosphoesterase domain-containing protein n=1 Tax=Dictyostelium discoideum TaxID=44689 RepID=Q54TW1_DICDI|nr:hypothetical protein DDB_G0281473 [Dictyostelium discoideum AX4]EAL66718.1 hypothetical protein DDB_G0281473 [Dictyostelium discoideum AX4]|eukprot:XP_640700.1 hypothetical protein DDB_G0281473 [Dictyostelium discoideum AX4]